MEIKNTATEANDRITALIYGPTGIGKTSLAKTLDGKTLIISAESGLLSLVGSDIDYVEIDGNTAKDKVIKLGNILGELKKGTDYDNIFIDSLTEINQIFIEHHFDLINWDKSKSLPTWGDIGKSMRGFIKAFRDLSGYSVFMLALDKVDKDEIGRRFITPDLNGQLSKSVGQFFDEVFYYTTVETEEKINRVLITSSSEKFVAKDRSGKLAKITKPDLGEIQKRIRDV